jgi:hypothetical protein
MSNFTLTPKSKAPALENGGFFAIQTLLPMRKI